MSSASSSSSSNDPLVSARLNKERYLALLTKLIGESKHLQNRPPEFLPQESLAGRHVLELLEPLSEKNGGPLKIKVVEYHKGRNNILIEYPATADGAGDATVSFVGSHMDVVFANPKDWRKDPFKLEIDGDILHGRGTTDCLGHVALTTEIFVHLATLKPKLNVSVVGVLIADEELGNDETIGVMNLMKQGELERIKNGPVYWLDCADKMPNIGTGGCVQWSLKAKGKMFHSGFPHMAINAIELAYDALRYVQKRFNEEFPRHPQEKVYKFPCGSSFKATNVVVPEGSLNQIKGSCTIQGDLRLVPFYRIADAMKAIEGFVKELNDGGFKQIEAASGFSYDKTVKEEGKEVAAEVELKWHGDGIDGLACDLDSSGFRYLKEATQKIVGKFDTIADTGSLPLVADLKAMGCDVQTIGYGIEEAYHADNEYAKLSDFEQGFQVLMMVISRLNADAASN